MSIPTLEQLKWIRKENLTSTNTPIVGKNYIVENDGRTLQLGTFLGEKEVSETLGGYKSKSKRNEFTDISTNENFSVYIDDRLRNVYEIPESIDTIIPPVPTQEDKDRFPTSEQLKWFRSGKRPKHEPETTEQYYLQAIKSPQKYKYYLFRKNEPRELKIGYLFNVYTEVSYHYNGANGETRSQENYYEFKPVGEEKRETVRDYGSIPDIYEIPATLPTTPPPPLITGIFKRVISIKPTKHDKITLHELTFHDGSKLIGQREFNYIEVKQGKLEIKSLKRLLTDPDNSISGTYVSLEEIQGTCSDGDNIKKLFMKFDVDYPDEPLNVETVTLEELKKVMDETDQLTKSELEGLCSIKPPSEIVGPNQTELQELTHDLLTSLSEVEKIIVKTYIVLGDYTCEVELVSFTPQTTKYPETFNQGYEPYTVPQKIIVSSRVNRASIYVDKVYVKKSYMDDIKKHRELDTISPVQSDIYYKPIAKDPKVGDQVFFYESEYDVLEGKVKSIKKTGMFNTGKIESCVVEYSDDGQLKTKTLPVSELYEIDKGKTITGGRRRKTRIIFKKKHSQNKRTSRIRNSLKKSFNKRRQRRTRKYGRTHSRK